MKDSKEYSKKVGELHRSLKRKQKVQKAVYETIIDALVYAIVGSELSESATQSAIKKLSDYFVDWNELRVSRTEEIVEVLGEDTPATRGAASVLTTALRSVFNKYNMVSLEALHKTSKRAARTTLEKIDGVNRFVVDYCMLTALQGHAIPLTKKMIEYLRSNELVHPEADEAEIEGFLARRISADKAYEFYYLLRRRSESGRKRKAARKTETKTKKRKK
jgi:endonuclease III